MQSIFHDDYYLTGKLYPKLDAYMRLDGDLVYICSSAQFRTIKRFEEYINERMQLNPEGKIIITKELKGMPTDRQLKAIATRQEHDRVFIDFNSPKDIYAYCSDGIWVRYLIKSGDNKIRWDKWEKVG